MCNLFFENNITLQPARVQRSLTYRYNVFICVLLLLETFSYLIWRPVIRLHAYECRERILICIIYVSTFKSKSQSCIQLECMYVFMLLLLELPTRVVVTGHVLYMCVYLLLGGCIYADEGDLKEVRFTHVLTFLVRIWRCS